MPTIELDAAEIQLLVEALDSHEYWQLAEDDERNNGYVYIPGDDPESDEETGATDADDDARYDEIRECRALAEKLRAALTPA